MIRICRRRLSLSLSFFFLPSLDSPTPEKRTDRHTYTSFPPSHRLESGLPEGPFRSHFVYVNGSCGSYKVC